MQKSVPESQPVASTVADHIPKDVLAVEFNPTKKLAHFVVELINVPGALEHSAALATKHHVNILSGFHHAPSASKQAFWSFFADFTDATVTPAELSKEFKALPSTANVRFQIPPNGLLIDTFHFPLRWGGDRAIMMRTDTAASIFARVNDIFGNGPAARVVLFEMGEAAGSSVYENLKNTIGLDVLRNELSQVVGLYKSLGWGDFELMEVDFDKKTAGIRVRENFECMHYRGQSSRPRSNFIRGHLAGWFSELFGNRVEVTEEFCIAKGNQFCEFRVETPLP